MALTLEESRSFQKEAIGILSEHIISSSSSPRWGFASNGTHMETPEQIKMSTVCVSSAKHFLLNTSSYFKPKCCRNADVMSLDASESNESLLLQSGVQLLHKKAHPFATRGHYKSFKWENKNKKTLIKSKLFYQTYSKILKYPNVRVWCTIYILYTFPVVCNAFHLAALELTFFVRLTQNSKKP